MQKLLNRPWLLMTLCSLLLAFFFTACGTGGLTGTSPTPTPTPSPTPSPTPKPSLPTYTGDGYSISYPQGWTVKQESGNTIFTDTPVTSAFLIQTIPNPNGAKPATDLLNIGITSLKNQAKNYQAITMPNTTTVGGATWNQGAATANTTLPGITQNTNLKIVFLATNYPANSPLTKTFIIIFAAPPDKFDAMDQTVFQPMLQSFKFAA